MRALLEVVRPQLETQWSLITRRQALDGGLTRAGIDRLVRDGIWEVLDRALYGPTGVPMTWHRQLMAAVLAVPLGATASRRSCAHLHEDANQSRIDERRTSALEALGWRVLRVRSAHFASDMHAVLRELDRIWRQTN